MEQSSILVRLVQFSERKDQAKQVSNGQECGITLKDFVDFQKNDTIEAYSTTSTERMV